MVMEKEFIKKTLKSFQTVNFQRLANVTSGFSGADIAEVCRKAKLCALKEMTGSKVDLNITPTHYNTVLNSK